jgi:hypothetical protein
MATAYVSEEEAAAALIAVELLLAEQALLSAPAPGPEASPWQQAGMLMNQGVPVLRPAAPPAWGNIERLRVAGRPRSGIVGL